MSSLGQPEIMISARAHASQHQSQNPVRGLPFRQGTDRHGCMAIFNAISGGRFWLDTCERVSERAISFPGW